MVDVRQTNPNVSDPTRVTPHEAAGSVFTYSRHLRRAIEQR